MGCNNSNRNSRSRRGDQVRHVSKVLIPPFIPVEFAVALGSIGGVLEYMVSQLYFHYPHVSQLSPVAPKWPHWSKYSRNAQETIDHNNEHVATGRKWEVSVSDFICLIQTSNVLFSNYNGAASGQNVAQFMASLPPIP